MPTAFIKSSNWNFKEGRVKRLRLFFSGLSLVVALSCFVFTFSKMSQSYDVSAQIKNLHNSGRSLSLPNWKIGFLKCDTDQIEAVGCLVLSDLESVSLPLSESQIQRFTVLLSKATHARATYELSSPERHFLNKNFEEHAKVALVVARSVQNELEAAVGLTSVRTVGVGRDLILFVSKKQLLEENEIQLSFEVSSLPWFGPSILSPYIVVADAVDVITESASRLQFSSDMQSQLELGFPVLFSAVAMVLDESSVYSVASGYGALRAVKAAVAFLFSRWDGDIPGWAYVCYVGLNGVCLAFLIVLVLLLTFPNSIDNIKSVSAIFGGFAGGVLIQIFYPSFYPKADLFGDFIGCGVSAIVTLGFIFSTIRFRKMNFANDLAKGMLLLFGLTLHGYVNFTELSLGSSEIVLKNSLDWKHAVLFPSLLAASLVNLGSLERKMKVFARKFSEAEVIDHELKLAKELQKQLLPTRKFVSDSFEWRLLALPATSLAGDWADVVIVQNKAGKRFLVGCLIDVTGHGIGAALATGTLCSQWNLWRKKLELSDKESSNIDCEYALATIAQNMSDSLVALGREDSCTAAFFLWMPEAASLTYLTCGHPGMLLFSSTTPDCKYLRTSFSGLGASYQFGQQEIWKAQTILVEEHKTLALYSDGLIPTEKTFTKWLKDLRNNHAKEPEKTIPTLGKQLWKNRKQFRTDVERSDDITLLFVGLKPQK